MTDSLEPGGAERVAVLLANDLAGRGHRAHLWPSRTGGPLAAQVAGSVGLVPARRRARGDLRAVREAARHVGSVDVIHAHGTSLATGLALRTALADRPALVWHDHYGRHETTPRRPWPQRAAWVGGLGGVLCVSRALAAWNRKVLPGLPADRIRFLPNYSTVDRGVEAAALGGGAGCRVLAVGNLTPQKDHRTLLEAMAIVRRSHPAAHLTIVGRPADPGTVEALLALRDRLDLAGAVTFAGPVPTVDRHLRAADVTVLSSSSEGFPLALVEYGLAGRASVVTDVGECSLIADGGRAARVVPPSAPGPLAAAIGELLASPELRGHLGETLLRRTEARFGRDAVLDQLEDLYDVVVARRRRVRRRR